MLYGMAGVRLRYGLCADGELLAHMRNAGQPWAVSSLAPGGRHRGIGAERLCGARADTRGGGTPYLLAGLRALGLRVIPGRANYLLFRAAKTLGEEMEERGVVLRGCGNYPLGLTIHGIERLCARGKKTTFCFKR